MAFTPRVYLGSPYKNAESIVQCLEQASLNGADMALFPKSALTGATLGDIAHFPDMLMAENNALNIILKASESYDMGIVIGKSDEDLYIRSGIIQKVFKNEAVFIDGVQYICGANPAVALGLRTMEERIKKMSLSCPVIYAGAGYGESTTDTVPDGVIIIAQRGELLGKNEGVYGENYGKILSYASVIADVSTDYQPKMSNDFAEYVPDLSVKTPFLPENKELYDEFAQNIFNIQVASLARRMEHIGAKTAVVAVSGGLDSALTILVAKSAVKLLSLPMENLIAVTLPCFGTTGRTLNNAKGLMAAATPNNRTIVIKQAVEQHFKDLNHDMNDYSVVFENAQARERTQIGLDLANKHGGIFVGTGDLSELCLGFTTFAGDHMSMYGVNAGLPKTLVRFVVNYLCGKKEFEKEAPYLKDILATPISPELLPPSDDIMSQKTEKILGSYDLHDYVIYHFLNGKSMAEIYDGARRAFKGEYEESGIKNALKTFFRRFVTQQFKRNCAPEGVSLVGLSLSPRGGLDMPSDMLSDVFNFI